MLKCHHAISVGSWWEFLFGLCELTFVLVVVAILPDKRQYGALCLTFTALSLVSAFHAMSGDTSCGCFGSLAVAPIVMTFVDSFVAIICTIGWMHCRRSSRSESSFRIGLALLAPASTVVVCIGFLIRTLDNSMIATSTVPVSLTAEKIRTSFAVDIENESIVVLKQSCPSCTDWLARTESRKPVLVAMLVDDCIRFFESTNGDQSQFIAPLLLGRRESEFLSPMIVRFRGGTIVEAKPLLGSQGD